jgi:hypothetical protein
MGITHIVNMTEEVHNLLENKGNYYFHCEGTIAYLKCPLRDEEQENIEKYF